MRNEQLRHGFMAVALAILGVVVLGGCAPKAAAPLNVFVAELLRNAAAALAL